MTKDDDPESPPPTLQSSPRRVSLRRPSLESPATGLHDDGGVSGDLSLPAAILHSTSPPLRAIPRFDVTASGTTARLSTSLLGHVGTHHTPYLFDDENNTDVTNHEGNESSARNHACTLAPKSENEDPEKTPLLGSVRPSLRAREDDNYYQEKKVSPTLSPGRQRRSSLPNVSGTVASPAKRNVFHLIAGQIPAIALIGLFHLMIGIPFGVSYFPVGWRPMDNTQMDGAGDGGDVAGPFPLPGKEAVGIRMFLFSTAVGQIVFTLRSQFHNAIGLQMVENVPFCQTLATIVMKHQGYGIHALSTLLFIFGVSSIVVGSVFWLLGRYRLGRVIYFFPTHVLMGCIGGVGLFLARTAIEVSVDRKFDWVALLGEGLPLVGVVFGFEITLRILQFLSTDLATGESRYPLLSPVYFCLITPVFYGILWVSGISIHNATDMGFFFPPVDTDEKTSSGTLVILNDLFDLWSVVDARSISREAVWDSIPTMVALTLFSLIHVPINIPAFAISSNTEVDINNELVAHGYSNLVMGLAGGGGLQNYMAYTQSVLYSRSGGTGKASGIAVAVVTLGLFVVGPTIASYIPRCMAGCLLFHVGIDLFLEAVYDSIGRFDYLEYVGIWLIVVVMAVAGLEAAMIAGVVAAVSTYAVQSMTYLNPVRGTMSAATLRSSRYDRPHSAHEILDDPSKGHSRIMVIQLQGHLFFGNTAQLTEFVQNLVQSSSDDAKPWIIIMDFMLVLGIDSSAAQALGKLRSHDGFPTEFGLSKELSQPVDSFSGSHVVPDLDQALRLAEDSLLVRYDPAFLHPTVQPLPLAHKDSGLTEERDVALKYLSNLAVKPVALNSIETLFACFKREVYGQDEIIWRQDECVVYSLSRGKYEQLVADQPTVARIMDLICIKRRPDRKS
eukprot:scaffold2655_cov179-Amphora_coffeaeformis.AAC.25